MKKAMAKGLILIAEAGVEVMAERIKKRKSKNGNHDGLDHLSDGHGAYGVCDRSADHSGVVGRRAMRKRNARRRSISKG